MLGEYRKELGLRGLPLSPHGTLWGCLKSQGLVGRFCCKKACNAEMCSLTKLKSCRQEHKHVSKTRKTSVHRKMLKIKPTILKTTPPSDVSDSSSFLKPNSHLFNTRVWASSWSALPSYPPSPLLPSLPPSFLQPFLPSSLPSYLP